MAEWIDWDESFTVSTTQTMVTPINVFTNSANRDLTVVDGYVTILTDTDELCQVRMFGPVPGFASSGDFAFATPERKEALNWYWFNCGRGPMVFRIRSKRTFDPLQELWIGGVKLRGAGASTLIMVAGQFLTVESG